MDSTGNSNSFGFIAPDVLALIVDDNKMDRSMLRELLDEMQIRTESAYDGKEAVEKTNEKMYDIIFMDQQMPVLSGSEATEAIRRNPRYAKVPIIAVTADDSEYTRCLLMYEGTNDCFFKPISVKKLVEIIEKWIPKDKIKTVRMVVKETEDDKFGRIDGLDFEKAVQYLGSKKLYREFVSQFVKSYARRKSAILEGFADQDFDKYASALRGLKVSARQIGAFSLAEKAERLEEAASREDSMLITREHLVLVKEYDYVIDAIMSLQND